MLKYFLIGFILLVQIGLFPRLVTEQRIAALDSIHLGLELKNRSARKGTESNPQAIVKSDFGISFESYRRGKGVAKPLTVNTSFSMPVDFIPKKNDYKRIIIRRRSPDPYETNLEGGEIWRHPLPVLLEDQLSAKINAEPTYHAWIKFRLPLDRLDEGVYEVDIIGELCEEEQCYPVTSRFLFEVYTQKRWLVPIHRFWAAAMSV